MNKKYLLYLIVPVMALASIGAVYANSTVQAGNGPMADLVNAIAQRFNLNADDVQQVFDEQKETMKAQMEQKFEDRINQAVADSELTQEQANLIFAKRAELKLERENWKASFEGKTKEETKTLMQEKKGELKQWSEENDISLKYLHPGKMGHGKGFQRGGFDK